MKTNATSARVENWVGQQVIEIDQHRGTKDKPGPFPPGLKKYPGNNSGD
jgi:hypothetical protein